MKEYLRGWAHLNLHEHMTWKHSANETDVKSLQHFVLLVNNGNFVFLGHAVDLYVNWKVWSSWENHLHALTQDSMVTVTEHWSGAAAAGELLHFSP